MLWDLPLNQHGCHLCQPRPLPARDIHPPAHVLHWEPSVSLSPMSWSTPAWAPFPIFPSASQLQTMWLWCFIRSSTRTFLQNCKLSIYLFKNQTVLITRNTEYGILVHISSNALFVKILAVKIFCTLAGLCSDPCRILANYCHTYVFSSPMIVLHPSTFHWICLLNCIIILKCLFIGGPSFGPE